LIIVKGDNKNKIRRIFKYEEQPGRCGREKPQLAQLPRRLALLTASSTILAVDYAKSATESWPRRQ
jgi:hypothetical protein